MGAVCVNVIDVMTAAEAGLEPSGTATSAAIAAKHTHRRIGLTLSHKLKITREQNSQKCLLY